MGVHVRRRNRLLVAEVLRGVVIGHIWSVVAPVHTEHDLTRKWKEGGEEGESTDPIHASQTLLPSSLSSAIPSPLSGHAHTYLLHPLTGNDIGRTQALDQLRVAAARTEPSHHNRGPKKEEKENNGGGSTAAAFAAGGVGMPVSRKGKRGKQPARDHPRRWKRPVLVCLGLVVMLGGID